MNTAIAWLGVLFATNALTYLISSEIAKHKGYDKGFNDYRDLHRATEGKNAVLLDLPNRVDANE